MFLFLPIASSEDSTTAVVASSEDSTTAVVASSEDSTTAVVASSEDSTTAVVASSEDSTTAVVASSEDSTTAVVASSTTATSAPKRGCLLLCVSLSNVWKIKRNHCFAQNYFRKTEQIIIEVEYRLGQLQYQYLQADWQTSLRTLLTLCTFVRSAFSFEFQMGDQI